ncbi:MAG: N-6 DNA methylase, partial [Treponema sp.]|nr:N-6 DNA methylase [Treponema sp.]
ILTAHIFGVDIDAQAVEVTKLSLLLKALEGMNEQEIQKELFNERVLPDLSRNIKCGNSLIGTNFYAQGTLDLTEDDQYRINAFDWETEFAEVFRDGGFDAVIGNPPWGANIDDYTRYFEKHYPNSTQSYKDSFKIFIEKACNLSRDNAFCSFIVPSAFMLQPRYIDVRRFLRDNTTIHRLWNIGDGVFGPHVAAPCGIFIIEKKKAKENHVVLFMDTTNLRTNEQRIEAAHAAVYRKVMQNIYKKTTEEAFVSFYRELKTKEAFLEKILDIKDAGINYQRVNVGLSDKGNSDLSKRLFYEGERRSEKDVEYWKGIDINAYFMASRTGRFVNVDITRALRKNERVILNSGYFAGTPKILWRQTAEYPIAALDTVGIWFGRSIQSGTMKKDSPVDIKYILAIFNSKYFRWLYEQNVKEDGRIFPQIKLSKLAKLPIPILDLSKKFDKARHDKLTALVDQMLALKKKEQAENVPQVKTMLGRQIQALDKQIDSLVYELYGLTEEEIRIVEGKG